MPRTYHELVPYAFKRFSVRKAFRTGLPTLGYYLSRSALPESEKPALCTMNILPPLATVWWHFAKRAIRDRADVVIFDCSGKLDSREFEGARVQKFLNLYAATKCEEFLYAIARNRKVGWICDDDMFLLSPKCIDVIEREFQNENTASVSFRPRGWWQFDLNGKNFPVSSSYCTAINREIFCEKEKLSLAPASGNSHPPIGDRPPRRYDTFDKANEILLQKGYDCVVLSEEERDECITGFSGMSTGVMLLNYFKTPQQTIDYFTSPPKKQWGGTVLHDTFGAMLAISIIQDLYEKIRGERYLLPSLPLKEDLAKVRAEHEPLLAEGRSWRWVDEVGEKLKDAL